MSLVRIQKMFGINTEFEQFQQYAEQIVGRYGFESGLYLVGIIMRPQYGAHKSQHTVQIQNHSPGRFRMNIGASKQIDGLQLRGTMFDFVKVERLK